jgi:hypothetical protein
MIFTVWAFGDLESMGIGGVLILAIAIGLVGVGLYRYIRNSDEYE